VALKIVSENPVGKELFDGCRSDALSSEQTLKYMPRLFAKRDVRVSKFVLPEKV
jgi:hypothetical protein